MFPMLVTKYVTRGLKPSHLAIFMAVLVLLFVIPALFDQKKFRAALEEFMNAGNPLMRVVGFVDLLLAFLLLNTHKSLNFASPLSFLALLGYLLAIKGTVRLWFPGFARERAKRFLNRRYSVYLMAAFGLLFAAGMGYLGIWEY